MAAAPLGVARAELVLAMFERTGCIHCRMWNDQIGPIWPRTAEGAVAPLFRIDLDRPLPEGITLASRPVFTPTFVLLRDGVELDRLEGYPGEDFFWGLIGGMLREQPEWAMQDSAEGALE
ncbi:thioredoxin family protein [Rhodovulum strictum]|uniref:Thioredoxin family protein n=1 Tax=Rhodovulum strictum TaxID=58314 RepID=A0A844BA71_9RHOB|nr:thioredoxin family protein [Rhodovulum strictum]MRH19568.1 thioredoxin family protein [Rhodovulum strictum]